MQKLSISKRIEKKEERKKYLIDRMKKMNAEVEKINNEIDKLKSEELAEKMKSFDYVLKQKNLDIVDVVKAIENGDLSQLEEKMLEGEIAKEETTINENIEKDSDY
ncbi:hypothetical protein P5F43_14935 [Clostridium perfringens]|uniref:hypothetical protein n=1 Tax=Clostridium TaxID=1485 RepID=UPI002245EB44|nr:MULTISPECIES: hypothetical protein [Clostridium]EGT4141283.1 hypothetical protein [Clostridium perfringens]ELC8368299.1 hypothetical protein [Clostridium perfringens]MCX0366873.1 hypothetical protein [Clostridium perfringens]MCX0403540.1 hypothetical protein [Clostridium perfringens]MDK0888275.1 hypothetical protein [Clostridium perfringens]